MLVRSGIAFRPARPPAVFDHASPYFLVTDRIFRALAITPLERPDLRLARALWRQDVAVAIDVGRNIGAWADLFASLSGERGAGVGLRVPDGVAVPDMALPAAVRFIVAAGISCLPDEWRRVPVIVQACSVGDATAAIEAGAAGLIAKGQESGGLTGCESSFVLLQRLAGLMEARKLALPVWCQGGVGLHTAAGAIAGGAFGVVIDSILAGYAECALPEATKAQILGMDGSEVQTAAGYQIYARGQREAASLAGLTQAEVRAGLAAGRLLPAGQDAALARLVREECPTIEALIKTMRMRVAGQIRQARSLRVLDEGSAWARAHGTRYPVAQGPMTRVSDTAEFAASVAAGGGLPFLALSMMQEPACRGLMETTRDRLGDRPWGVGVLAFAAAHIINPQLALVRELRPSFLVLAGGRPAQARPFVDMGIPTYLHVPSPGLLDMFLKEGATHFIFEGRECGGHVGPRYSFVLWEQALALLEQMERPETLHILFAGGIHDARSGAMVAAIAARLAARGAKIGVLMGSAYIATEEAVSCGAILPGFQRKALAGGSTVLVETAPGHAIRCLPSGFMDLFDRERARLHAEGVERKQAWRALEALTVGRLRVATKGLDYVQGVLAPIDAARQEAEGMYMIGQVIALRREVTSVAALHADVSCGACTHLDALEAPALVPEAGAAPVAIVGMGCIFPGAPDLEGFWANILQGRDAVCEVPAQRWNIARYFDHGAPAPGKSVSKWGGFIADTPFDPVAFGIPPQSLAAIEPVQLLSLEVARAALRDAGYEERWFDREKTAVIFGAESGADLATQYSFRNVYPHYCGDLPAELAQALPSLTEDSFPGVLVNVISGRIANRLGLGGVNYAVDSACASSLTALELGVKELRAGSSDMVLAGGADFHNGISDFLMFSSAGALSPTGRCRSFDDHADGICLGEGVGVVVLKRLEDAERDGDRIYAVIDGVAGASDGRGLGLTAPRKEGQKRALERAYWQAGVLPADVGLVEAHGTGTVVGDRTELKSLTEIYDAFGAVPGQAALGSVKSQIGHTKCAAGMAGLIKLAKALHHGVLPPTRQIATPNAWHKAGSSPFRLESEAAPWLAAGRRRAAVSAFGFGGTNFHAVLSAYPAHRCPLGAAELPAELFAVRGDTVAEADALLRSLAAFIAASDAPVALRDVAHALWQAGSGPVQIAFVAEKTSDLPHLVEAALARAPGVARRAATSPGKIACLFSGQGSQYPGMLRDLFVYFPLLRDLPGAPEYAALIYPPSAYDEEARAQAQLALTDTRNAQPALGLVELAAFKWLRGLGLAPDMLGGHSYGELAALAAAGAFDIDTLLRLSRARAACMMAAVGDDPGAMAAVRLDAPALAALLADFPTVVLANQNSPVQTVISGPTADVRAASAWLERQGVGTRAIDTACAFHSPLMGNAESLFAAAVAAEDIGALQVPVYGNIDAAPYENDAAAIRARLARHIASPVRFVCEIQRMYEDGARVFLEIGPRQVLTGLVGRILKERVHTAIALDPAPGGLAGIFAALAKLAVILPGFDAGALFEGRTAKLDLATPRRLAATTWMVNGGRVWPLRGEAPAHAAAIVLAPVRPAPAAPPVMAAPPAGPEEALVGYLANMRELVNAQRDVLVSYFGNAPVQRAALPIAPAAQPAAPAEAQPVPAQNADHRAVLLDIVGARTGYPAEMLDPDLDLEADLSIDSIKRLEIVGALAERLGLAAALGKAADNLLEELAGRKTLRAMMAWLDDKMRASEQAAAPAPVQPATLLIDIVSDCTGYPKEILDLDLDLEADLSIDSIKRVEIAGRLAARGGGPDDGLAERMAGLRTLRAMIACLESPAGAGLKAQAQEAGAIGLARYVLRAQPVPPAGRGAVSVAQKHFLITDDGGGLARHVAARLTAHGASCGILPMPGAHAAPAELARADGLIHLGCLNPDAALCDIKTLFAVMREALLTRPSLEASHGASHVLVVSGLGGDFGVGGGAVQRGGGVAGLVKAVAKEFPALRAHVLDIDPAEPAEALASYIEQELLADHPLPEVAYKAGTRYARDVLPASLAQANFDDLPLTPESVVLLTGGARGITALAAVALARRARCHIALVGRSAPPPENEDPLTMGVVDARALRRIFLDRAPGSKPAELERQVRRVLAERDARATLAHIREAGGSVTYTALDVRDNEKFAAYIDGLYERHGRIDGVVHGAGVIEDRLVADKTNESFGRVFDTKVQAAAVLHEKIRDDVKFVVFFSSVASAFGNRGQADYAAANDVLDKLACCWQARIAGRVLSVNWGPWADTGMVSDTLRREYHRRGIGLIAPDEGVAALLRELCAARGEAQVVLMCATPASFGG
jgi:acyl transferase domain-containing protein/NAD(P)H-dependent flavin oxidoreductase YrpB (nitropropane dioxygenase family)/acyl carrier protein